MTRRHPFVRVQHVWIRHRARRRARKPALFPLVLARGSVSDLRGHVDEPTREARVDTFGFTVRGWCTWGDRPALAVAVCLDGVVVGRSAVGSVPRHDVGEATRNEDLVDSGWQAYVDPGRQCGGEAANLSVLVWGDVSSPPVVLDEFPVFLADERTDSATDSGDPQGEFDGHLHQPRAGESVGEVFPVRGWATRRHDAVGRLDVLVNGEYVGRARLGLPNPGLEVERPEPGCIISGFEYWVDLTSVSSATSTAKLQLVAGSSNGRPVALFERVLRVKAPAPATDRSERAAVHGHRREQLLSTIVTPRSSDLNLVVFTHQLDYGGGQFWLEEFLKQAGAGSRFACTVISFKDGPLRESAERRGIAVHITDEPPVDDPERYEGRITELAALVVGGGHNVALVNTAHVFSGADVAARLSLPTVWAVHESFPPPVLMTIAFPSPMDPGVLDAARSAMEAADALVFEAAATRDLYADWAKPGHSVVVPYGVDTGEIRNYAQIVSRDVARAEVDVRPESRMILVMGTIEQRKAQTRIAQAFARIADDLPEWELVFVGDTKSDYSQALRKYIGEVGLTHRCRIAPIDSDTYRWYRSADLLLSASDVESLPRSMLEAMSFGVPVVSAAVFGVPELVTDGESGFLFEPNDLDALVAAFRRVLALDASQLTRVGAAGQRHVFEHYDSSGYADELLRICHGLLQDPGSNPHDVLSKKGQQIDALGLEAAR
jgi:glycosyltransferase involved in cell wall biosynthesis